MEPTHGERPLVIGHRGAPEIALENTVAAFRAADEAGADGVELDVRLTSDDVMVIHHDPRVDGFGTIWDRPFAQLREEQPHVPTLDEAVDACGAMLVNIEIKNDPDQPGFDPSDQAAQQVAAWVSLNDATDRVLVSSFNRDTVATVKAAGPDIETGQLVAHGAVLLDWIDFARDDGHGWLLPYRRYLKQSPQVAATVQAAGLKVGVWTVNGRNWLQQFAEDGVDAVITNKPSVALAVYGR